jgi:putative phosphoesterase
MKIAAIYDLHGNLPALEAALEEIRCENVDLLVVGGDILPGPMPPEMLEMLLNLEIPTQFIQGNGEIDALNVMREKSIDRVPELYRDIVIWSAQQIADYENVLASWAKTFSIGIDGIGKVLFCHATPRDDNEIFTRLTDEKRLLPIFTNLDADLVICGHTHLQFDRMIGEVRVVNAGSLGMPFGKTGADWLLLSNKIEFRHTDYDLDEAVKRILETDYPQAKSFAEESLLNPPSEEVILEAFSKAKLLGEE